DLAGVGDEARGAAVVQDVRELLRLDARIDDQEHAAGLERGKDRHHGVGGVVQIHGDPIGSAHAGVDHRVRERVRPLVDLSIGPALAVAHQRNLVGEAARAALEEFFYLHVVLPVVADRKVRTVFVVAAAVVCGRSGLQAAISAFRLTNCTSRSMESRFSGTSSSSWMVKPYFCSRKLTSSRTPVESMMPSSSNESPLASGASSLPKRKFSTMNCRSSSS